MIISYVDDLIFAGTELIPGLLEALAKEIEMEAPHVLDKYLGSIHRHYKQGGTTRLGWDMSNYLSSGLE